MNKNEQLKQWYRDADRSRRYYLREQLETKYDMSRMQFLHRKAGRTPLSKMECEAIENILEENIFDITQ